VIFIFILIFGVIFLFVNLRQVAPGNKGSILAGALVVLLPICFIFRDMFWACVGQAFLSVWLCEALLLYICWWIFRLCRRVAVRRPMPKRITVIAARVLLAVSFAVTGVMCAVGYFHNEHYILRESTVELHVALDSAQVSRDSTADVVRPDSFAAPRNFTALFFSDLHLDPLIRREKVERMLHTADSVKPDLILFGGDFADIHDSVLTNQGYDTLFAKFAAVARVGAFAVSGNHEAYTERDGSDIAGFLRRSGWVYLEDSTACTEVACITGRMDFQVAGTREMDRKPLALLEPGNKLPWLLMDHQPKGIEPEYSGRLPDFALSGHTHKGQFFPGTVIINWVWRLAYGFGTLDSVRWLVSSGVDSWGPPVRIGSDTEMWLLHFVLN
jgi:predicted MPP superfamily phosphohydrolase